MLTVGCVLAPALPRRHLRSGKEFSPFDLGVPIKIDFDIEACLQDRVLEQKAMGSDHEAEEEVLSSSLNDLDLDPPSPVDVLAAVDDLCPVMPLPSSGSVDPPPAPPLSSKQRNKLKSHARRARARQQAQQSSSNPKRKTVHTDRLQQGKSSYIEVEYDANGLPHTIPAWIGSRNGQDDDSHFAEPGTSSYPQSGMGGKSYTQEDINRLANTVGFVYICWLGLYVSSNTFCLAFVL
jgi:hypothetical protein